jgi:hypothetical protein
VVLLSSDDLLKPTFVEKAMGVMLGHPGRTIGLVAAERDVIDETGRLKPFPPFYNQSCIIPGTRQAKVFLMGNPLVPSQVLLDRRILQPTLRTFKVDYGGQEGHRTRKHTYASMADCAMWFQIFLASDFGYLQEKLVVYREHFKGEAAAHMGSLRGVFELYVMKRQLIEEARRRGLDEVVAFGEDAIRKIGMDCLKWATRFLEFRDTMAARRLMHLGLAIDPALADQASLQALAYVLGSNLEQPFEAYQALIPHIGATQRSFSYDPPEGFVPLEGEAAP